MHAPQRGDLALEETLDTQSGCAELQTAWLENAARLHVGLFLAYNQAKPRPTARKLTSAAPHTPLHIIKLRSSAGTFRKPGREC
jgi:hypothetical protein